MSNCTTNIALKKYKSDNISSVGRMQKQKPIEIFWLITIPNCTNAGDRPSYLGVRMIPGWLMLWHGEMVRLLDNAEGTVVNYTNLANFWTFVTTKKASWKRMVHTKSRVESGAFVEDHSIVGVPYRRLGGLWQSFCHSTCQGRPMMPILTTQMMMISNANRS